MTDLQKIAIDFETNVLTQITKFYRSFESKGVVDINSFISKNRNIAKKTMENMRNALAQQVYDIYSKSLGKKVKDKDFYSNKNLQTIITKADDSILSSVSYAIWHASIFYSSLINKKRDDAYKTLNDLYNQGLQGSAKYKFEGTINFVDNESAFESDLAANIERAKGLGKGLVYIPQTYSACNKCSVWQGKYLIDDVYVGAKSDGEHQLLSYAMSLGFLHPNCRDTFIYVDDEESHKLETIKHKLKPIEKENMRKRYEAEQRQRVLAKQVRTWKRKMEDGVLELGKSTGDIEKSKIGKSIILADNRIKEKMYEVRELRDNEHLLRVNYSMFQTNYEYKPRKNWDFNSLRNKAS